MFIYRELGQLQHIFTANEYFLGNKAYINK